MAQVTLAESRPVVRLDLGCGKAKKEGYVGVDAHPFDGVDLVHDLRQPWPWDDDSVEAIHSSHFIEHLTAAERCHFVNEAYRVLRPGGQATLVAPHWSSNRAYGDPTHAWPPVSEMWFMYLGKVWREANAPHTSEMIRCDFDATWGYSIHQVIAMRAPEAQQFAINFYKEACQDIVATLTAKK